MLIKIVLLLVNSILLTYFLQYILISGNIPVGVSPDSSVYDFFIHTFIYYNTQSKHHVSATQAQKTVMRLFLSVCCNK